MAGTLANAVATPIVGASSSGQISSSLDLELFMSFMEPVEVHEHEISQWLPKFSKAPNQVQHWTGQSYNPPIDGALTVATTSSSKALDLGVDPIGLGFRVNDIIEAIDYYPGQTLYQIASTYERGRVESISGTTLIIDRHSGQLTSGNWYVHPIGTRVRVKSRAVPYKTAFDNAPVWRGDAIYNVSQRIPTGFIRVDKAKLFTPTREAENEFQRDIENWRERALDYREDAWINGVRILPTETVAGQVGGMGWWAGQVGSNVLDLLGKQISIHHLADRIRLKRRQHKKRAGSTVITDIDTMAALDYVLEPYKRYDSKDDTVKIMFDGLETRWGKVSFMPVETWPPGMAMVTDKSDWEAGNYAGMDWEIVEQKEANTGAPVITWATYGDFTLRCKDVYRQIKITNINTFVDRYMGRRVFRVA